MDSNFKCKCGNNEEEFFNWEEYYNDYTEYSCDECGEFIKVQK